MTRYVVVVVGDANGDNIVVSSSVLAGDQEKCSEVSTIEPKPILTELPGHIVLGESVSGAVPSTMTFLVMVSEILHELLSVMTSLAV